MVKQLSLYESVTLTLMFVYIFGPSHWSVMDRPCLSLCAADDECVPLTQRPHSSLSLVQLMYLYNHTPFTFTLGE